MMRLLPLSALTVAVLVAQNSTAPDAGGAVQVPLPIVSGVLQSFIRGVEIPPAESGTSIVVLPGNAEARVTRLPSPAGAIMVTIRDATPPTLILLPEQASMVQLPRMIGAEKTAAYLLGYSKSEKNGTTSESFMWRPVYRAEGKLRINACEKTIYVFDFNGDGVFDEADSRSATTLGIDMNGDGRLWGADEYNKMAQIVEVCGLPLQVETLDASARFITFRRSGTRIPAIGDTLPLFSLITNTGRTLRSEDFRDRVHVLDFWASWCAPCVEKLESMDEIAKCSNGQISAIGVNVDEPEKRSAAEKLMQDKRLQFPQVIRALGEKDYLWQMFGSMSGNRLSIPLYVVTDTAGRIRYAGNGGDSLDELKHAIRDAQQR